MAADEYVVWQSLKKMKAREYICLKKKNTKKLFFSFCFLQLLLCKHHIKYAYRDLNGSATSSGFMCSFLQGFQVFAVHVMLLKLMTEGEHTSFLFQNEPKFSHYVLVGEDGQFWTYAPLVNGSKE